MAVINPLNSGIAIGRLAKDPVVFTNKDGSKKVVVSLALRNNYKDADGNTSSQFIDFEGFVASGASAPVFDMVHSGDLVSLMYELRNDNWTDKSGIQHYDVQLRINDVRMLESKETTSGRRASRKDG